MDMREIPRSRTLFGELDIIEDTPLDSKVLESLGFTIVNYIDLDQYKNIEELCGSNGIILFTPVQNAQNGHYSAIFLLNGDLYYWCSYGYGILKTISISNYLMHNVEDRNSLIKLINEYVKRTDKRFIENTSRLQSLEENMSTCGRYCIVRLMNADMDHDKFHYWFTHNRPKGIDNDRLISAITYLI